MKFVGESLLVKPTGKRHQSYVFKFRIIKMLEGDYDGDTIVFEQYHDFGGGKLFYTLKFKAGEYEDEENEFGKFHGISKKIAVCQNDIFEIDLTNKGYLTFKKLGKKKI